MYIQDIFGPLFAFPLSVSFHQSTTRIFICLLLVPEGQTIEAWDLPTSNALSEI
jgi:hypothetical protein